MDAFKRHIEGFNGNRNSERLRHAPGQTCPCCREVRGKNSKTISRRLARKRLHRRDQQELLDRGNA